MEPFGKDSVTDHLQRCGKRMGAPKDPRPSDRGLSHEGSGQWPGFGTYKGS